MPDRAGYGVTKAEPTAPVYDFGTLVWGQALNFIYHRVASMMTAAQLTAGITYYTTHQIAAPTWAAAGTKTLTDQREKYALQVWNAAVDWADANTSVSATNITRARVNCPYDSKRGL